jgi:hypothetical protein
VAVVDEMSELLSRLGLLCIPAGVEPSVRRFLNSQGKFDEAVFMRDLDTDEPVRWISHALATYIYEIAHELQALGAILSANLGPGSFEVIVRAIVERAGRISWLLEEGTPEEEAPTLPEEGMPRGVRRRGIRIGLEILVCQYHYCASLKALEVEQFICEKADALLREEKLQIQGWFDCSRSPADVTKWVIEGEAYPSYRELAQWALKKNDEEDAQSLGVLKGTYSALSGWSHPNFLAAAEHLAPRGFGYGYSPDYLKRLFGLAISATDKAIKAWLGYYDQDHDVTVERLWEISSAWEALAL